MTEQGIKKAELARRVGDVFPDVPEALTFGVDEYEALLHAVDALEAALSFHVEARKPLSAPGKAKRGQRSVRPSALESAKLGVYQAICATPRAPTRSKPLRALGRQLEVRVA